jgi:antitoxin VapB
MHLMDIARVFTTGRSQAVRIPRAYRLKDTLVSIRREGEALILEPIKPTTWPEGFFEAIAIDDPGFKRPDQGEMPEVPALDRP